MPISRRNSPFLGILLAPWVLAQSASAQAPEIRGVVFGGVQRGTSGAVRIEGANLRGVRVFLSGRGVRVEGVVPYERGDSAEIRLTAASDAPLGAREIRLGNTEGVSNPARIWIDPYPEVREAEPNDGLERAQRLEKTPVILNGRLSAPADLDVFAFRVRAKETWVFDGSAARICSRLDPVLELYGEGGRLLRVARSDRDQDPRLVYRFEKRGRYFLRIRDSRSLGGADYTYRLAIGPLPLITRYRPYGERPGRKVGLEIAGVNLGHTTRSVITMPEDTPEGEYWVSPQTARGPALPISLLISRSPVADITETDALMPLPLIPGCLDGTFLRYPRIRFFFEAAPKDHLVFDLWGRRIGSRIKGALRVLDASGKELLFSNRGGGKDARLEFTPPTDGFYTIEAWNEEEKTGPDCFYRLEVRRATPDFRLYVGQDRIHVGAGGTAVVPVSAERLYGFDSPITLQAENLPTGVVFSGGTIAPGESGVEVTLTAPPGTPLGPTIIRLRGAAMIGGQEVIREGIPLPHASDSGASPHDGYRPPCRAWELLPLGIIERAEPFALEVDVGSVSLKPGEKAEIMVRAIRQPEADGEIQLELRGLPPKVTASTTNIATGQNEARLILIAALDAPASLRNLIIRGRMDRYVQPAPAVRVEVIPTPSGVASGP